MTHVIPLYALVLIGVAVGALTGITGSSGVLIVVPALSYLGLSFKDSIGSSLLVDVITTTSVIYVYFTHRNVDVKKAVLIGLGAVLGAQVGSAIAFRAPVRALEIAFSTFTAYMAYVSFRRSKSPSLKVRSLGLGRAAYVLAPALSFVVGLVTGTLGASGGIMFIAIMMLLYSMEVKRMIGTATLAMFMSAASGAEAYIADGMSDVMASVIIGAVAMLSGIYFARLANRMRSSTIYKFLGSVFVLTTISELVKII